MILRLENRGEELVIILNPAGQDEVAPRVLFELFGVVIGKLQCGTANIVVQACPCWVVVGVEVVWLHVPYIAGGVDKAVRQVHANGHGAPKVADKETKGMPLAGVTSGPKSVMCCLEVDLYVLDKVQNLVQSIQAGLDPADNKSHVDICDLLMLAVCLEDKEDGSSPTELRRTRGSREHECTLSDEFPQAVEGDALHAECLS